MRAVAHRVHAEREQPFHVAAVHVVEEEGPAPVLVAAGRALGQPRMQVVAEAVVPGRGGAVVGLELADDESVGVRPEIRRRRPQRLRCHGGEERVERGVVGLGHRDVARQVVVRHAAVGAALDVGVTAQRIQPAASPPDVAQQQLQHRRRVDELHRVAVMRPAERVKDSAGLLRGARRGDEVGHLHELVGAAAANLRDLRRRVARVERLHHLEHRARMLQGRVDLREAALVELVGPARGVGVGTLAPSQPEKTPAASSKA